MVVLDGTCEASLIPVYVPGLSHPDADNIPTEIEIAPTTLADRMISSVFCSTLYNVLHFI